jgi:hypothetical protein
LPPNAAADNPSNQEAKFVYSVYKSKLF